ncbi:MAG: outer membrane protein assembly factor BamD [Bacteroidia bacterium]
MKKIFFFILIIALVPGCKTQYQKTLKNPDTNKKLELAQYYYNKKDYYRASTLFEQLQESFAGTSMAEKVMYYSAYCNFGLQNNLLAGYQFKMYYENFPTGKWAEECLYMYAYCLYLESQHWYLDQTDTFKALEAIKLFISVYPDSKYIPECNQQIDKLRTKLMYKSYRNAKMYYRTGEYASAAIALQNVIKDYPETPYKEELDYLTVKSHYLLTNNSIDKKKEARFAQAVLSMQQFTADYPDSKYLNELKKMNYKCEMGVKHMRIKTDPKKEKEKDEIKS